jgi:soluble lytic murein transglycosylase-like protein
MLNFKSNDTKRLTLGTIAAPLFAAATVLASPHSTQKPVEPQNNVPIPVEQLQQKLSKDAKSKIARALGKAYAAFKNEKYLEAIQVASKFQSNEEYSDYATWVSASAHLALAQKALEKKNTPSSLSHAQKSFNLLHQIDLKSPYSPFVRDLPRNFAEVELLLGDLYWSKKDWRHARQNYERAFQRLQSQNKLAMVNHSYLDHYSAGCSKKSDSFCMSWLQRFTNVYGKKADEIKAIARYFPEIASRAKPGPSAKLSIPYKAPDLDQVAFDNSMKIYFEGKHKDAIKNFRQFLDEFPRSAYRFRTQYWLAQSLRHEDKKDEANQVFQGLVQESPLSYYGLLASTELNQPIQSGMNSELLLGIDSDPYLQPQDLIHLKRAKHFLAEKSPELAAYELKEIKIRDGFSSPFIAYLAHLNSKAKNFHLSFQFLGELLQRKYPGIFSETGLPLVFPVQYYELIEHYSEVNHLDPILVLSLMKQESAFEINANSFVGAMGLMQLMPATAVDTDPAVNVVDLVSPEHNIRIGTKYLGRLLNRFNGNLVFALASYNAGPTAVDRWIKSSPPERGMQEFIESIPYRETREYVSSIIRNYFWYTQQLNQEAWKGFDYFWKVNLPRQASPQTPETRIIPQNGNA